MDCRFFDQPEYVQLLAVHMIASGFLQQMSFLIFWCPHLLSSPLPHPFHHHLFICLSLSLSILSLRLFVCEVCQSVHLASAQCDVCLLVGCLTSQQQASVSQGRICTDNFTCCHTEIEAADQTFHLTQSQYTDTGPTSPSADPITPGAWQGSHWSANFEVTGMTRPRKNPGASGIRTRDLPLSRRTP